MINIFFFFLSLSFSNLNQSSGYESLPKTSSTSSPYCSSTNGSNGSSFAAHNQNSNSNNNSNCASSPASSSTPIKARDQGSTSDLGTSPTDILITNTITVKPSCNRCESNRNCFEMHTNSWSLLSIYYW